MTAKQRSIEESRKDFDSYFKRVFNGFLSLVKGMWLTINIFSSPSRVITSEYPENRDTLKMHDRFRGQVIMPHNEEGDHNCTGCTLCEKACPNGTISILQTISPKSGKKVLGKFIYRFSQCTLCNLCIEACPFDAIFMGQEFEEAKTSRDDLVFVLNKREGKS